VLRRISGVNMGTNYTLLVGAFTLSATILLVNQYIGLAILSAVFALIAGIALIRLLIRLDRADRMF
jgi:Flp pilus assembly protein TadB